MSTILFAPSGSGKSHATKNYTSVNGLPLVDGDDPLGAAKLYPKGLWWKEPGSDKLHLQHSLYIGELLARNPDLTLLWWSKLEIAIPVMNSFGVRVVGLLITEEDLKRNWESREKSIAQGVSNHSSRPWESYQRGLERARLAFPRLGVKTYSSWDAVSKDLFPRKRTP